MSKGATVFTVTFIVYLLMLSLSAGEDNSIPTIILMSSYGGFVVAAVVYAVYKLCAYIGRLLKK